MRSSALRLLFIVFAPIAVPLYILFLAVTNLLGGAFYIVVEASLSRIARRPITLSRLQMALLAIPVLALSPLAAAGHLLIWFAKFVGHLLCRFGTWQTGAQGRASSFVIGLVWTLSALWVTITCMNAAVGLSWIGRPIEGRDAFVEHLTRGKALGEMPAEMQAERQRLIRELDTYKAEVDPDWEFLKSALEEDDVSFRALAREWPLVGRKLAGVPWFFEPGELSQDGLDHSALLLGPLFFAWMLLICWPGMLRLLRFSGLRWGAFIVRTTVAVVAIAWLAAWEPITSRIGFDLISGEGPSQFLNPLLWFAADPGAVLVRWIRPEFYLFNTGLWLAVLGGIAFVWWLAWRVSPFLGWPRYYVSFMASRLLQRKRIAFFSVGAVTLCVAMMIIVISVMGGFLDTIRNRAHGLLGDLVMDGGLQGFPYYQEFIDQISQLHDKETGEPLVVQATPLIHSYGILQFPKSKMTKAVRVWGVRLDEYVRVNEFGKNLFYNNRFGGTSLKSQKQPFYGFDEDAMAVLPAEMEAQYLIYKAGLSKEERAEEEKEFRREPGDFFYPGPGVFEIADGDVPKPCYEGRECPGVIIGRDIIAHRMPSGEYRRETSYPRGEACVITVLPLTRSGDVSLEPPPKPAFRYVDDSRTGIHEIDSMNVYVDFDELQQLLSMGPAERADGEGMAGARCSQIQIKLSESVSKDKEQLHEAKQVIDAMWDQFRQQEERADFTESRLMAQVHVATWEEMQRSFISAVEKEKFLVLIMFGVISIVAVFLILCIFYMIVQEKVRDIGIIKSVGGSAEGVAAVFLVYGGAIGLVGCILGSLLGITFVEHINDVQDWLARLNPDWRVWSPETYSFDKIPDAWKLSEVIWISVVAVISSVVGAAFPAIRASRTWPVESLRYE